MQGTAAQKLALFEKLKARGGFAGEDRAELLEGREHAADVRGDREGERVKHMGNHVMATDEAKPSPYWKIWLHAPNCIR